MSKRTHDQIDADREPEPVCDLPKEIWELAIFATHLPPERSIRARISLSRTCRFFFYLLPETDSVISPAAYLAEVADFCASLDYIKRKYWVWLCVPLPKSLFPYLLIDLRELSYTIIRRGSRYLEAYWLLTGSVTKWDMDYNERPMFWQAVVDSGDDHMFARFLSREIYPWDAQKLLRAILRMPRVTDKERHAQREFYQLFYWFCNNFSCTTGGSKISAIHITLGPKFHEQWKTFLRARFEDDADHKPWFRLYFDKIVARVGPRTKCWRENKEWFQRIQDWHDNVWMPPS